MDFEILLKDEWCKQMLHEHKNIKQITIWKLFPKIKHIQMCKQQWMINKHLALIINNTNCITILYALLWLWMYNGVVKLKRQQNLSILQNL